jgi:hypothetical protein
MGRYGIPGVCRSTCFQAYIPPPPTSPRNPPAESIPCTVLERDVYIYHWIQNALFVLVIHTFVCWVFSRPLTPPGCKYHKKFHTSDCFNRLYTFSGCPLRCWGIPSVPVAMSEYDFDFLVSDVFHHLSTVIFLSTPTPLSRGVPEIPEDLLGMKFTLLGMCRQLE